MKLWSNRELEFIEKHQEEIETWKDDINSFLRTSYDPDDNYLCRKIMFVSEYLLFPDKPFEVKFGANSRRVDLDLYSCRGVYLGTTIWVFERDGKGSNKDFYERIISQLCGEQLKIPEEFARKVSMVFEDDKQKIYKNS